MQRSNHSKSEQHDRLAEEVASGCKPLARMRAEINDSWRRCLSTYKLAPEQNPKQKIVSGTELRERRERSDPLYSIARIEMAGLAQLLNAPVGVMLTDDQGVILDYSGAPSFAEIAHDSGLREGAIWSEAEQGTNGMGTCLVSGEAVLIEEEEHFLLRNSALTCCGAPILDGVGRVIGAINISGRLRLSAAPTLALVRLAVQNIQNRTLVAQSHQHCLLRFHPHREFISTAGEGILAIDGSGLIVGANPSALSWLGFVRYPDICGQSVEEVFGVGLRRLEALASAAPLAQPLPKRQGGSLCFGILQPSLSRHLANGKGSTAGRNVLREAERKALREVLDRCHWNVSLAAIQLGMNRRTLHRKLSAHGLRRYTPWDGDSDTTATSSRSKTFKTGGM